MSREILCRFTHVDWPDCRPTVVEKRTSYEATHSAESSGKACQTLDLSSSQKLDKDRHAIVSLVYGLSTTSTLILLSLSTHTPDAYRNGNMSRLFRMIAAQNGTYNAALTMSHATITSTRTADKYDRCSVNA